MDNNIFGRPEENSYEGDSSVPETQNGQQTYTNTEDTQAEKAEEQAGQIGQTEQTGSAIQTEQYYSGSVPQYSRDVQSIQNPYSYENISSQNPYSHEDQNRQNTYTYTNTYSSYADQGSQSGQSIYSSSYDNQNSYSYNNTSDHSNGQDGYSYHSTNSQDAYSHNGQSAYGNQNNTQNIYSYGYQNSQNAQDDQNPFSYGTQNNQGQANHSNPYASSYGSNNTGYQGYQPELEEPVKMGDWLLLQCLLSFIPCVGIILAIVWAFSKTEKQSKVNFCKAYLIVILIRLAIVFVVIVLYGSILIAAMDGAF